MSGVPKYCPMLTCSKAAYNSDTEFSSNKVSGLWKLFSYMNQEFSSPESLGVIKNVLYWDRGSFLNNSFLFSYYKYVN